MDAPQGDVQRSKTSGEREKDGHISDPTSRDGVWNRQPVRVTFTLELGQLDIGDRHSNAHRIGTRTPHGRNRHRGLCDCRCCARGGLNFSNVRQHRWLLWVGEQSERIWFISLATLQRAEGPGAGTGAGIVRIHVNKETKKTPKTTHRTKSWSKSVTECHFVFFDTFCHKGFVAQKSAILTKIAPLTLSMTLFQHYFLGANLNVSVD